MKELKVDKKSYLDLVVYVLGFAAIILTPYAARLISPFFDWVGYGALIVFFDELFTSIFWVVEIVILAIIFKKCFKKNIIYNSEVKGHELPAKRITIITCIVILCIIGISAQIEFQVKPFYDLGEKFNGYELLVNCGVFIQNIIKCMWITIMIKAMQGFFEGIMGKGKLFVPFAGLIMLLTLGVYDVIIGANNLPVTYLALYAVYGMIYLLTERHTIKSYLLIMFICLF